MTRQAVHSRGHAHILRSSHSVFSHCLQKLVWPVHCNNVKVRDLSRLSDRKNYEQLILQILESLRISGLEAANWTRAGMVEWNEILGLFQFSSVLGQPPDLHTKF